MAIPKTDDIIVTELKRICETQLAMPVTFVHGNMSEVNFALDKLGEVEFPVLVFLTDTRNQTKVNEAHHLIRTATIKMMLLNRLPLETIEFKSGEINKEVNFMRRLGENLIYWINKSPYSVNGGVSDFQSDDIYQRFDAHLFGQGIVIDWALDTGTTGYYNNPGTA